MKIKFGKFEFEIEQDTLMFLCVFICIIIAIFKA
jgi:hypothetical protein